MQICVQKTLRSAYGFEGERMHVVAPKEASTCRSKGRKGGEWIEEHMTTPLRVMAPGEKFTDEGCGRL